MSYLQRLKERDEGVTLIELMVTALLSTLVVAVIAGIMLSTTTTERSVRTVTTATTAGQLVSRSVEQAISNAATPLSLTTPAGTDQLLLARTAGNGSVITWSCSAWYYSAADKTVRYTTSSSALGTVTYALQSNWTLLSTGVRPVGTGSVFTLSGTKALVLSFTEDAGTSPVIVFTTTITSQTGVSGSTPCF